MQRFVRPRAGTYPFVFAAMLLVACGDASGSPEGAADATVSGGGDGGITVPDARDGSTRSDGAATSHAQADAASPATDRSSALFDPTRVLDVHITLSDSDFAALRAEGRSLSGVISGCERPDEFSYTTYAGDVTVAGQTRSNVGVRKKGLLGSLSVQKPSLRVDLDEYVDGQDLSDERVLTLNNSLQDDSFTHTCMAYAVFEAAGVVSPRCNFARVAVNGRDLGAYVHVEAVKKPFLARRFGNDDGDLYEGVIGDFSAGQISYLTKKTNEGDPLSLELSALVEALDAPDSALLGALEPLLDVDQFMRFWATEVLIAESDGYAANQNNYFVYVHPDSRKIVFVPWGPDGAFNVPDPKSQPVLPVSVYAKGRLTQRLYDYAPSRERYRQTLQTLLDDVWDETALLAEVDRIAALLGDAASPKALDAQRAFIRERRAKVAAELSATAPAWPLPAAQKLECQPERVRPIQGRFEVTLGGSDAPAVNLTLDSNLEVELKKGPVQPGVTFGFGVSDSGGTVVGLSISELDGSTVQLLLISQRTDLTPGDIAFHGFETFGIVLSGMSADTMTTEGYVSDGTVHFDVLELRPGGKATGHFEGKIALVGP